MNKIRKPPRIPRTPIKKNSDIDLSPEENLLQQEGRNEDLAIIARKKTRPPSRKKNTQFSELEKQEELSDVSGNLHSLRFFDSADNKKDKKDLPLRNYSSNATPVLGVKTNEDARSKDELLRFKKLKTEYYIESENYKYIFAVSEKGIPLFVQVPGEEILYIKRKEGIIRSLKNDHSYYSLYEPEAVGVVVFSKGISKFITEDDSFYFEWEEAEESHVSIPVFTIQRLNMEDLSKVYNRIQNHTVDEHYKMTKMCAEEWGKLYDSMSDFITAFDERVEMWDANNSRNDLLKSLCMACDEMEDCLDLLRELNVRLSGMRKKLG